MSAVDQSEAEIILEKHNCARRRYKVAPLKWDWQLAEDAAVHANRCIWKHASEIGKAPPGQGENLSLAMGKPVGVDGWLNEESDYSCPDNRCLRNMCGHWTQMLWHSTARVGCAKKRCPSVSGASGFSNADFLVCRYSPPGNYIGRQPVRASQCADGASTKNCPEQQDSESIIERPDNIVGRDGDEPIDSAVLQLIALSVAIVLFLLVGFGAWWTKRYADRKKLFQKFRNKISFR